MKLLRIVSPDPSFFENVVELGKVEDIKAKKTDVRRR